MPLIDVIADGLPNQMIGDRERRKTGVGQDPPTFLAIVFRFGCSVYVKMVTPTGELQAIEAHFPGERCEFGERKIGPLAGEESYWSSHRFSENSMQPNGREAQLRRGPGSRGPFGKPRATPCYERIFSGFRADHARRIFSNTYLPATANSAPPCAREICVCGDMVRAHFYARTSKT